MFLALLAHNQEVLYVKQLVYSFAHYVGWLPSASFRSYYADTLKEITADLTKYIWSTHKILFSGVHILVLPVN
jgi:hypothetical protein